jgi:lysophospholipase L1-like esterase
VLRIFTLGDSSVYGYGVEDEEVFSSVAASALSERLGRPCEAVNGATPGYSSEQSLSLLRQLGVRVGPDWVVIASLWSDLYDRNRQNTELIDGGAGLSAAREGLAGLATYRLLRRALAPLLRSRRVAFAAEKGDLAGVQGTRSSLPDYILALWTLGEESRRLGAQPLYLTLPAPMDEDPAGVPETVALFREAQRQVAAGLGAVHVDGVEVFDREGLGIGAFLDQVHPAAQGHRALGLALAEALARAEERGEAAGR